MMKVPIRILAIGAVAAALVGCGGGSGGTTAATPTSSETSSSTATVTYTPKGVLAGLPVTMSTDQKPYQTLVAATTKYGHRGDPFQLTAEEAAYDKSQDVERVLGTLGGFTTQYELPPEETKDVEPEEVQPYRRLAGIVVGDSVLAIIDMGDGKAATIIRPGMKITGTEWTVVSINEDRALLHRDGTVSPHTISVRLESPPSGMGSTFGGPPTGGPQNGPPRGGPPGRRGPGVGAGGGGGNVAK